MHPEICVVIAHSCCRHDLTWCPLYLAWLLIEWEVCYVKCRCSIAYSNCDRGWSSVTGPRGVLADRITSCFKLTTEMIVFKYALIDSRVTVWPMCIIHVHVWYQFVLSQQTRFFLITWTALDLVDFWFCSTNIEYFNKMYIIYSLYCKYMCHIVKITCMKQYVCSCEMN